MAEQLQAGLVSYDARIDTSMLKADAAKADAIVKGTATNTQKAASDIGSKVAALVGATAAVAGVVTLGKAMVTAFGESQAVMSQTSAVLQSTGGAAGVTAQQITGLAAAMQKSTAYSDEQVQSAENLLLTFNKIQGDTFPKATQSVADLATAMHTDLRSAALQLGKALQDPTQGLTALRRSGISFSDSQTKTIQSLYEMGRVAEGQQIILDELNRQVGGSAEAFGRTLPGQIAIFKNSLNDMQESAGGALSGALIPLLSWSAQFVQNNQQLIVSIGSGVAAFVGLAGAAYIAIQAFAVLKAAFLSLNAVTGPLAIIGILIGIFAGVVMSRAMKNIQKSSQNMTDLGKGGAAAAQGLGSASDAAKKLARQLSDLDAQIVHANRDFSEQLAETIKRMQTNVKEYAKQLSDENRDFEAASRERMAQFNKEQGEQSKAHQDKVSQLQKQIDFLRRYNNASNRQQLAELQFALDQENSEYQAASDERLQQLEDTQQVEAQKHEERVNDIQSKLDEEKAALQKHADDVAAIRDVQLLDEIDKLKRSHDEQIASLNQQKVDAVAAANSQQSALNNAYANSAPMLDSTFANLGTGMGESMTAAFKQALKDTGNDVIRGMGDIIKKLIAFNLFVIGSAVTWPAMLIKHRGDVSGTIAEIWDNAARSVGLSTRAQGGPVRAGQPYAVGDNPDGSWNRTTELFVPNRSGTIIPSKDLQGGMGGNITVNVTMSGVMTSSPADERAIAQRLVDRINESLRAKGAAQLGVS